MTTKRWAVRIAVAGVLAGAIIGGSFALATPVRAAGGCKCPLIYAPVACDHGKTYPNQCVADCHNAKNCVPTGGI